MNKRSLTKPLLIVPLMIALTACEEEKKKKSKSSSKPEASESDKPSPPKASDPATASGLFDKIQGARSRAKTVSAMACMSQLVVACDSFYETYQYLPMANTSAIDATQVTDNQLMAAMVGLKIAQDENPQFHKFFQYKAATEDKKDGLYRTENSAELFDPWGNHYHVFLNYDYDNQMRPPVTNQIIFDRRVVAWSNGPDGKSGTPETNADNIYSWKVK